MGQKGEPIENISIDLLRFDPENPRLPSSVDGHNEKEVLAWMVLDASLIELMGSIGAQGYFSGEPLLVVQNESGDYTVVEGNRRLAAVKLLGNPDSAPKARQRSVSRVSEGATFCPRELPCTRYDSREDILNYLGYRHITGVKEWDSLAKARYLRRLADREPDKDQQGVFRDLAVLIGSRADYIARLLTSYALYERIEQEHFYDIKGLGEGTIDFSVLTTSLNYGSIVQFLGLESAGDPSTPGLNSECLRELVSWMFKRTPEGVTRLGESRNLKPLASIVEHEHALKQFRQGASLEDAARYTAMPKEAFRQWIARARDSLKSAREVSIWVDDPDQDDLDILDAVSRLAGQLKGEVSRKLSEASEDTTDRHSNA